jgi:hypothetical protein
MALNAQDGEVDMMSTDIPGFPYKGPEFPDELLTLVKAAAKV